MLGRCHRICWNFTEYFASDESNTAFRLSMSAKKSADETLKYLLIFFFFFFFFFFPRKSALTIRANCRLRRQLSWNVEAYFSWIVKYNITYLSLPNVPMIKVKSGSFCFSGSSGRGRWGEKLCRINIHHSVMLVTSIMHEGRQHDAPPEVFLRVW